MIIIPVDHGNKQIKTENSTFISGFTISETKPAFGENIIKYNNKYFVLSNKRFPYLRDKTKDDTFFILTLFAIAFEINFKVEISKQNEVIPITLLIGLPPAHFGGQHEDFQLYFKGKVIKYSLNNKLYSILIQDVYSFPQAYAASLLAFDKIKVYTKTYVIDIGGFTLDYLKLVYGKADLSECDSLEYGVIVFYNKIKSKVNSNFKLLIDENMIDDVLFQRQIKLDKIIYDYIIEETYLYVNDMINQLRERMIDLKVSQAVFTGGGSILLKKYIENSKNISSPIFIEDIKANVKGYKLLYNIIKGQSNDYQKK